MQRVLPIIVSLMTAVSASGADVDELRAYLRPAKGKKIEGLHWASETLDVRRNPGKGGRLLVRLAGTFVKPGYSLVLKTQDGIYLKWSKKKAEDKSEFELFLPVKRAQTRLEILATSPGQATEKMNTLIAIAAQMTEVPVEVEWRPRDGSRPIEGLTLGRVSAGRLVPRLERFFGGNDLYDLHLVANGTYRKKNWGLVIGSTRVNLSSSKFSAKLRFPFRRPIRTQISGVGPHGKVNRRKYTLIIQRDSEKKLRFSAGLGVSFISYTSPAANLDETALTAKAAAAYRFASRYSAMGSVFFTALPISTNVDGTDLKFLGLNARVGYLLPEDWPRWELRLWAGVYYTTTFSSGSSIGYENLMGPQLYPQAMYRLGKGRHLSVYFKFSPIASDGFATALLDEREIATGIGYYFRLGRGPQKLGITFDFADLTLIGNFLDVSVTSYSLGAAFQF